MFPQAPTGRRHRVYPVVVACVTRQPRTHARSLPRMGHNAPGWDITRRENSGLLEVDPLDHGQSLQETAETIECQFDCTQSDPFATAEDTRPPELDPVGGG